MSYAISNGDMSYAIGNDDKSYALRNDDFPNCIYNHMLIGSMTFAIIILSCVKYSFDTL